MSRPKSHRRKKGLPTNARLAQLWQNAADHPDADEKFTSAIIDLLAANRLGPGRIDAMRRHLDSGEDSEFLSDLTDHATDCFGTATTAAGGAVDYHTALFAIPVLGDVGAIEPAMAVSETADAIARAVRTSGFGAADSSIVVAPQPLAPGALVELDPQRLYNIAATATQIVLPTTPEADASAEMARLAALLPAPEQPAEDKTLGVRFLVGARFSPLHDGAEEGAEDGLSLQVFGTDDAADDRLCALADTWDGAVGALQKDAAFHIQHPVPWSAIGTHIVEALIHQYIAAAAAIETTDDGPWQSADELVLAVDSAALHVSALRAGRCLTNFTLPREIAAFAGEDLFEILEASYAVTARESPDDLPRPAPTS